MLNFIKLITQLNASELTEVNTKVKADKTYLIKLKTLYEIRHNTDKPAIQPRGKDVD